MYHDEEQRMHDSYCAAASHKFLELLLRKYLYYSEKCGFLTSVEDMNRIAKLQEYHRCASVVKSGELDDEHKTWLKDFSTNILEKLDGL